MPILQSFNSNLFIANSNNFISYNLETQEDEIINVPDPILPSNLTKGQAEVIQKEEKTINSLVISKNKEYIALSTENKQVVVYDSKLTAIKNILINRLASKLCFTPTNDILVADKTGDVFLYKLKNDNSEPELLLGHLSMILDVTLSDCGKYIVTCDRDEKIRVSRFPNAYNIVSYCLGHKEFVTRVGFCNKTLISASGDGTIRFWDFTNGRQLNLINTNEFIGEKKLIGDFCNEMDAEKVDVEALPITDMQLFLSETTIFIAVTLHNYNCLQLYQSNSMNLQSTLLKNIKFCDIAFFNLTENLLILDKSNLVCYKLINEDCMLFNVDNLGKFYKKYQNYLKIKNSNSITVLYKRKFDNVQEYLERKKLRLESK